MRNSCRQSESPVWQISFGRLRIVCYALRFETFGKRRRLTLPVTNSRRKTRHLGNEFSFVWDFDFFFMFAHSYCHFFPLVFIVIVTSDRLSFRSFVASTNSQSPDVLNRGTSPRLLPSLDDGSWVEFRKNEKLTGKWKKSMQQVHNNL